ncbi:MAG: hypothetical protein ABL903_08205 [Methylococcales bacterium]
MTTFKDTALLALFSLTLATGSQSALADSSASASVDWTSFKWSLVSAPPDNPAPLIELFTD